MTSESLKKRWAENREEMLRICSEGGKLNGGFKGRHTEETKKLISDKLKAKGCHPPWELSPMFHKGYKRADIIGAEAAERVRQAVIKYNKTKTVSIISRIKMSEAKRRERNPGWKGGTKNEYEIIRNGWELKAWKIGVFQRDNYRCQHCGAKQHLNAHHIKNFMRYPELRFYVNNGVTLCVDCHKKTPDYGGRWDRHK